MSATAWIVTEDYNREGRYRFTAHSSREAAAKHAAGITPETAREYIIARNTPQVSALMALPENWGPGWAEKLAEVHVQVHEVPWPEEDSKPAERATVIGISELEGFGIQLIVTRLQEDMELDSYPWFKGYATICPENEPETAALVLDGPTFEGGDTAI